MSHQCPACQRSFPEPGFCPFDGSKLEARNAADQPTISEQPRAPSDADTAVAIGNSGDPTLVRAVSAAAAAGHADAMDTIRRRVSEYDHLIGETLDERYYVQRKIGEGGMGVVFAVKHTVIERPLAIKVLKRDVMRDQATIKRFIQEARAASRIGHPNIVDVTDFGNTSDGMTYQVMELIEGTTLSRAIKTEAPLPVERVVRVGVQIARALAAAHAKGIVHRDLKPENVFLTEREGRPDFVKIVDFGIAKVAPVEGTTEVGPRLTRAGSVFGTPEYMAPEQAAGRGDTDHRVDIYALGTILYEMLVAKTPHKGDSMIRTIAMQMLDPITPPSQVKPELGIPPEVEAIVMKALAKKREDRYQTMSDVLAALEGVAAAAAAAPTADTVPDIAPPETPSGPPRRNKPATRQVDEPQFVAPGGRVSFSHLDEPVDEPPPPSRWPMIVAGLLMLALGAGLAIGIVMWLGGSTDDSGRRDLVVATGVDARVVTELDRDAGAISEPADAQLVAELPARDAGVRATRDAGTTGTTGTTGTSGTSGTTISNAQDRKGNVTIEVMSRPGDADVFVGRNYRGPSGVRLTERYGTKLKIECKTERMKGSVEVVFDGSKSAVMCTASRDRFCVPGLKNPYDDCEDDPNAMP